MSENIAISTYASHVNRSLQFYLSHINRTSKNMILFGIGRKSQWSDETSPDLPVLSTTQLDEIIGYKTVTNIYPVLPLPLDGSISLDNMRWEKVNPIDSLDGLEARQIYGPDATNNEILYCACRRLHCRWLYISSEVNSTDFPTSGSNSFRQIGIYSNVVLKDDAPFTDAYLPTHIKDHGILEVYKNISPVFLSSGVKISLRMVMEF